MDRRGVRYRGGNPPTLQVYPSTVPASVVGAASLRDSFGSALTFARNSSRSCYTAADTSAVNILTANQPAVELLGLSEQSAKTNSLVRSQEFQTTWQVIGNSVNPFVSADDTTAPDGTNTADRLTSQQNVTASGSSFSVIRQQVTGLTNGGTYTFSVWLKAGTATTDPKIYINDTVTHSPVFCTLTSAWQRFSVTMVIGATTVFPTIGWFNQTANVSGQFIYMWGAQLEVGSFPTAYVPTAAATAVRQADAPSFAASFLPVAAGSVSMSFTPDWTLPPVNGTLLDSGTSGIAATVAASDGALAFLTSNESLASGALSWTRGQTYTLTFRWIGGNKYVYRDNTLVASVTNGSATMPTSHTACALGTNVNGWISNLTVSA